MKIPNLVTTVFGAPAMPKAGRSVLIVSRLLSRPVVILKGLLDTIFIIGLSRMFHGSVSGETMLS